MMTRGERAKIFAPFDAMKGLQEALLEREERHLRVARRELSEEAAERNSRVLLKLERGMEAEIRCYSAFHEVVRRGRVTEIDFTRRRLVLGEEAVCFEDLYSIEITDGR